MEGRDRWLGWLGWWSRWELRGELSIIVQDKKSQPLDE